MFLLLIKMINYFKNFKQLVYGKFEINLNQPSKNRGINKKKERNDEMVKMETEGLNMQRMEVQKPRL